MTTHDVTDFLGVLDRDRRGQPCSSQTHVPPCGCTHLPLLGQGFLQVLYLCLRSLHFCLELLTGLWDRRRDIKISLRARICLHDGGSEGDVRVQLVGK